MRKGEVEYTEGVENSSNEDKERSTCVIRKEEDPARERNDTKKTVQETDTGG